MWCLPGAPSAEFVWAMKDVLDIYTRPYDPTRPTVCLDETSNSWWERCGALFRHGGCAGYLYPALRSHPSHGMPGRDEQTAGGRGAGRRTLFRRFLDMFALTDAARYDHHYVRNGVATVFMMLEPLTGRCRVQVTQRRTKKDWAQVTAAEGLKDLVDRCYPEADALTLVMDNLSSHQKAALYDVLVSPVKGPQVAPEEAKRIADKIEKKKHHVALTFERRSCETCALFPLCPVRPRDGYAVTVDLRAANLERRRRAPWPAAPSRSAIAFVPASRPRSRSLGALHVRGRWRVELAVYLKALACNIKRMVRALTPKPEAIVPAMG